MSSHLSRKIAELVEEARHRRMNQSIVKELTMISGYGFLIDSHPQSRISLRKHLQAFNDLASAQDQQDLCDHSLRILKIISEIEAVELEIMRANQGKLHPCG